MSNDHEKEETKIEIVETNQKKVFKFNPFGKEPFDVEEVLTSSDIKLEERMTANVKPGISSFNPLYFHF